MLREDVKITMINVVAISKLILLKYCFDLNQCVNFIHPSPFVTIRTYYKQRTGNMLIILHCNINVYYIHICQNGSRLLNKYIIKRVSKAYITLHLPLSEYLLLNLLRNVPPYGNYFDIPLQISLISAIGL